MKQTIHCLAAFIGVTSGELLGAVGSVLGGIIGALGAAFAVFLTLNRQRKDERDRIYGALRTEVMEFCRLAVGHLQTCRNIETKKISILKPQFSSVMGMPRPIVYPATADRLGRLHAPHRIVHFYARIAEIERVAELIAVQPTGVQPYVTHVTEVAHAWMDVCRFGKWILEGTPVETGLGAHARQFVLADIDVALGKAGELFPEAAETQ